METKPGARVIKGADVAAKIRQQLCAVIEEAGIEPSLAIVRVGCKDSDLAYEKGIEGSCRKAGIRMQVFEFPETIDQAAFEEQFLKINKDPQIHGILLFRPLPPHLHEKAIAQLIDPAKDMDCMSPSNWAKLVMGEKDGYYPCTAEAVIHICDYMGIDYNGAKAVVIGRSQVIGKPVGLMLLARNATLTWCHSRTRDLSKACEGANILVSACGIANLVTEDLAQHIAPDCAAVDVGINFVNGKMQGDFDFEAVSRYAGQITPVPGGVGAVTNTVLALHVVRAAYKAAYGKEPVLS